MRRRGAAVLALALTGALVAIARARSRPADFVGPAWAEHQVSYRYVVLGYVTDADNRGRRGVRVELRREKTGFSYLGETDADGFYVIVARLGDESAGETLQLRAESQAMTLTARFDPADHATERGHAGGLHRPPAGREPDRLRGDAQAVSLPSERRSFLFGSPHSWTLLALVLLQGAGRGPRWTWCRPRAPCSSASTTPTT